MHPSCTVIAYFRLQTSFLPAAPVARPVALDWSQQPGHVRREAPGQAPADHPTLNECPKGPLPLSTRWPDTACQFPGQFGRTLRQNCHNRLSRHYGTEAGSGTQNTATANRVRPGSARAPLIKTPLNSRNSEPIHAVQYSGTPPEKKAIKLWAKFAITSKLGGQHGERNQKKA